MLQSVELVIPYPPSANRLWIRARKGMRKSDRYFKWLRDAGFVALSQRPVARFNGSYKLTIQAVRPDKRRRDLDNLIKPISDLLQAIGVVRDDGDCEMVSARWVTQGEDVYVRVETVGVE